MASVDYEREKRSAAAKSVEYVEDGMTIGLGTGSTAAYAIAMLGERVRAGLSVRAVPTSERTRELAEERGIPLVTLEQVTRLDLTIDGADEVDPDLQLIKGGGGALLHEKIVASASDRLVIIADSKKMVTKLGRFALPVEVVPSAWKVLTEKTSAVGCMPKLRRRADGREVFVTDERNYLLDCAFGAIEDHRGLASTLASLPGVVEHGSRDLREGASSCHNVERDGAFRVAPGLWGIVGAPKARAELVRLLQGAGDGGR